mmetsp:Transcript_24307/g.76190  ORF Transcript_24307/g.76190 Transcript_24307/m.76190 type:complete len:322 (+) Transcript_24307:795-1760(+)
MMPARSTSFWKIGPMPVCDTGMGGSHSWRRNLSSASRAPSVLACASTPTLSVASEATSLKSDMTSSMTTSSTSSSPMTLMGVPATTCSSPWPVSFTPMAPVISAWWMYSARTRISRPGGGVSTARSCVTTGPSRVQHTMRSPSRSVPLTSTASTVVPRPSMTLTSMTVHSSASCAMIFSMARVWLSMDSRRSRSGTPSPVMADVGDMGMTSSSKASSSQYMATLRPSSLSCSLASASLRSTSCTVAGSCASSASRMGRSATVCQPKQRSTLLSAMMKGTPLERSIWSDSRVVCSMPCMRSMTRMATSQRLEPRDRRLSKAS